MKLLLRGQGRLRLNWRALAFALAFSGLHRANASACVDGPPCQVPNCQGAVGHTHGDSVGTLGYGPPGFHPGFQGFGLGYHPGYGYGGSALGVGAFGGYPHYGGPGYPHCWPALRRLHHFELFSYYGGPGYPTPDHPNFYAPTGPLVAEAPVIEIEGGGGYDYSSGYGGYTGVLPYPESRFAPFTSAVSAYGGAAAAAPVPPLPTNPVRMVPLNPLPPR